MCTSTGDGEQTICKIPIESGFIYLRINIIHDKVVEFPCSTTFFVKNVEFLYNFQNFYVVGSIYKYGNKY
jgi:hypothetical protein